MRRKKKPAAAALRRPRGGLPAPCVFAWRGLICVPRSALCAERGTPAASGQRSAVSQRLRAPVVRLSPALIQRCRPVFRLVRLKEAQAVFYAKQLRGANIRLFLLQANPARAEIQAMQLLS